MKKTTIAVIVSFAITGVAHADINQAINLVDGLAKKTMTFEEGKNVWNTLDADTQKQAHQYDTANGTHVVSDYRDNADAIKAEHAAYAARLDSQKVSDSAYNELVTATHDAEAAKVEGQLKAASNVARTATQQVDSNAQVVAAHDAAVFAIKGEQAARTDRLTSQQVDTNAQVVAAHDAAVYAIKGEQAAHADRLASQKVSDTAYNELVTATHDAEAAKVEGQLKAASNVARTSTQQVDTNAQVVAAHDAAVFAIKGEQAAHAERLASQHVDTNAQVVAAHDAAVFAIKGEQAAHADRLLSQHVDTNAQVVAAHDAAVYTIKGEQAARADRLASQKVSDTAYNELVTATHNAEAAKVEGQLKAASNVARTATQHVNVDQAAADARLASQKVSDTAYNELVTATHDAEAAKVEGQLKAASNVARTATQHVNVDQAAADARLASQKVSDTAYNELVTATHNAEAAKVEGQLKAASNVARTATQHVNVDQAAADARLASQKVSDTAYNELVTATHNAEAAKVEGQLKAASNVARTATQHVNVDQAAADARLASQKVSDTAYNELVVATHDYEAAKVEGQLKAASNVARTSSQQVNVDQASADARLNSMKVDPHAVAVAANDKAVYDGQHLIQDNQSRTVSQHVDGNSAAIMSNAENIVTLAQGVDTAINTGEYAQSRADAAYANTEANRQAMNATNQRVADNSAELADHENRLESLESSTNGKFADLNKQVDDNRKRASAGIAGVAAMANIPQVTDTQSFSVGAGVGNTDGESALAVGASGRVQENWVMKASVSNDTQHNFVVGAGASYGW